jgi:hypothetical protein
MNTIGTMGLLKREENTGERLSLLEEEKTATPLAKTSRGKISSASASTKSSVGFICAVSLGAFALSASSSSKKNGGAYNIDAAFTSGAPMSLLGVSDQIDVMKSLIVDTCGKSALSAYEKTYSSLPGEKASEMGEREEEGDDEKYAKADAFLSKLKHAGGKKEDQEEDEDVEIDSSKNTDTFLREFNDMQKRMKETKKFANEEEDDLEEAKEDSSSDGERTVEEREDARFEKKLTKTLAKDDIDEEDEEEEKHRPQSSRKKQSSSSDQKSSSRSSASEDEDHRRPSKNFSGYREKFRSDADDEEFVEKEKERDERRSVSSSSSSSSSSSPRDNNNNNNQRERLYERKSSGGDKDDDKSTYASKGARRMLLEEALPNASEEKELVEVAEEEIKHTGVFALLQKMVGGEQSSQDPVKPGQMPQLGLPQQTKMLSKKNKKKSTTKKGDLNVAAGLGKSMGVHVDEEVDDENEGDEGEEEQMKEEEEEHEQQTEEQTRTDKALKLAQDGEKALEREAIEKVYKGDGSKSRKKSALEIQRGETSSDMSETDEEALEIENGAADKYYDVTKVEHLAQETLKRNIGGSKGEASMGEQQQPINTKALEEAIGRAANQSPDITRKELFSTLGRKSKEEFVNAARLKKLVELKHIATTCKPTLSDGGKAMERAKEAAQQAAMKVKQAAARRAEAEANYEHSQEVAKIAAQKVDDITELAQKKIQEVQEVAKRKVQNAKDISRLAGRKVEDEFDMLGKTKEDFNLHVQHAMKSVEAAKEAASSALEETKKKSHTAKQRAAALEVSLAKEYEEARTEREIEEKKLAKAEAQAEAAETEREQKVLEAHQRQMEIEKVAKERQYKLEEEQRQMEEAKKRSMAKSTQYRTSAEDALEKLSVIDFNNNKDSDDVARIGFGEEAVASGYPDDDETQMAMGGAASSDGDGFDPWTRK